MSGRAKEVAFAVCLLLLALIIVLGTYRAVVKNFNECEDRGGVMIHGTCLDKQVVIK